MEIKSNLEQYKESIVQKVIDSQDLWKQISIEHTPIENIIKQLKSFKINFIDPNFPPLDISLYPQELVDVGGPFDTQIQWRRAKDFMSVNQSQSTLKPELFKKHIEATDIKEGSLGNSWFLGALATLAEQPALIEKLFVNKIYNEEGVYRVRLCKNGEWQSITVDDYFPCHVEGGPIFSKTQNSELWLLILEKAYAKLHGSYLSLRGGFAMEAFQDLTGCPSTSYDLTNQFVQQTIENGDLWRLMQFFSKEKYLSNVSTFGEDEEVEGSFAVDQQKHQESETGLLKAHAYSILRIEEVQGNKLINLRNMWGKPLEWNGKWSDYSNQWTSQIKKIINPKIREENDGSHFWMSFEDFIQHFKTINVCRIKNWDEIRIRGKFLRVQDKNNLTNEVVLSRWYYTVDLKKKTHMFITLHQEDERILGVNESRNYIDIGILVLKQTSDGMKLLQMRELVEARQCELDIYLEEGTYLIVPKTSGCTMQINQSSNDDTQGNQFQFLKSESEPSEAFLSSLKDIFRKFDLQMNGELQYQEFEDFFQCIGFKVAEDEFQSQILDKFCSTADGLTFQGFRDFMVHSLNEYGQENMMHWLQKLGYTIINGILASERSRVFVMTVHSEHQVQIIVNDSLQNDIDFKTNELIIKEYGREIFNNGPLKIFCAFSENVSVYSFLAYHQEDYQMSAREQEEDRDYPIQAKIDLSSFSQVIQTNTHRHLIQKILEPSEFQFMFHAKIVDHDFKQPLKPSIVYQRIHQDEEDDGEEIYQAN